MGVNEEPAATTNYAKVYHMRYYGVRLTPSEYMIAEGKKDMSNKFKVGDKVVITYPEYPKACPVGTVGTVVEDLKGAYHIEIDGVDGFPWFFLGSQFETYVKPDTAKVMKVANNVGMDYNSVSKPAHYNQGEGIECIDYIKQVLGKEGFVDYCRGNLIKYNHRAMYKGNPTEDLAKAEQYLKWVNETLKEVHK